MNKYYYSYYNNQYYLINFLYIYDLPPNVIKNTNSCIRLPWFFLKDFIYITVIQINDINVKKFRNKAIITNISVSF